MLSFCLFFFGSSVFLSSVLPLYISSLHPLFLWISSFMLFIHLFIFIPFSSLDIPLCFSVPSPLFLPVVFSFIVHHSSSFSPTYPFFLSLNPSLSTCFHSNFLLMLVFFSSFSSFLVLSTYFFTSPSLPLFNSILLSFIVTFLPRFLYLNNISLSLPFLSLH